MRDLRKRLDRLEVSIQGRWPAQVEAAKARVLARVRHKLCLALHAGDDPAFHAAASRLADDTPEQAAADEEMLRHWARQHQATLYPAEGARARLTAALDTMARRLAEQLHSGDQPHG
jgi:chromosomal replication initiation ATPase DnaA